MTQPVADPVDRTRLPIDPWGLIETHFDPDQAGPLETVFAVGNGSLGIRGTQDEGDLAYRHGSFIAGFHETWPIHHAENAYGLARVGQTIIHIPDASVIALQVDGEDLSVAGRLDSYRRWIDFREGVLRREVVWQTASGNRIKVVSSRLVSFSERGLAQFSLSVTPLNAPAHVQISSTLVNLQDAAVVARENEDADFDPRQAAGFDHRVLLPEFVREDADRVLLGYRAAASRMSLAVALEHDVTPAAGVQASGDTTSDLVTRRFTATVEPGETLRLVKSAVYASSPSRPVDELTQECTASLDRARTLGPAGIESAQAAWLERFWDNSDLELSGQPAIQQAVRWCLFQLAQACGRSDGGGIAAKGVSGSGYEGHSFWDTETYLVPFLVHTSPDIAKQALRFRSAMLPAARRRARELAQRGALFPWRTINGEEASAYYPAGTAQYHIDADVVHAMCLYADVCADQAFLQGEALPVLVETARFYTDLGFWLTDADGVRRFRIQAVTGPDEYSAVVDNNLYTNLMAQENLRRAAGAVRELAAADPDAYGRLAAELRLTDDEPDAWEAAADGMLIGYDARIGIHLQDEHMLSRPVWDLAKTPESKHPLLLHYHSLVIYRHQVLKQADAVLAAFMAGNQFTPEQKRADFEYYDPITTGDSTLSAVVQSIMAAEVGYQQRALELFMGGVFVDLSDLHHNTADGVHIASAGGVWEALVYGFGGLRDDGGTTRFDPRLPEEWAELSFRFRLHGSRVKATLTRNAISFDLEEGDGGELLVRGVPVTVGRIPVQVPLADQGPKLASLTGFRPYVHGRPATDDEITVRLPYSGE